MLTKKKQRKWKIWIILSVITILIIAGIFLYNPLNIQTYPTLIKTIKNLFEYFTINPYITNTEYQNYAYSFKNNSNTAEAVRFEKDGYYFTYDLSGGQMEWAVRPGQPAVTNTPGGYCQGLSNSQDTKIISEGNLRTYPNAFCNTNVTYEIKDNGLKETFILSGLPSIKDYDYLQYSGNIKFNRTLQICTEEQCFIPSGTQDDFETSGKIYFKDMDGNTIFYLKEPVIYDSNGDTTLGIYKVHGSDAQMNFWLRIPTNFIINATFPIFADPTIQISESSIYTTSNLVNVTAETGKSNFTHLTIDNLSTNVPYNNLTAYYPFDGDLENGADLTTNTSTFTVYDFSGNNRDGTSKARVYVNSTGCVYGDCAKFDGNGTAGWRSYIELTNKWTFRNDSMTISLWANLKTGQADTTDARMITSVNECILRYKTGDRAEFILNSFTTNDRVNSPANTFPANTWTHVVGMYDKVTNNMTMWINGVYVNSTIPTGYYGLCSAWQLGAFNGASGGYYNGSLDEVMIFNTSLTSAQILAIYQNSSSRFVTQGTQKVKSSEITNDTTKNNNGFNRLNLTNYFENLFGSNISARIGQVNASFNTTGLVLWMPFEDDDNSNAFDVSNTGAMGTVVNAIYNSTGGRNNTGGFSFDGDGDYVNLNGLSVFSGLSSLTLSLWVRSSKVADGSTHFPFADWGDSDGARVSFNWNDNDNSFIFLVRNNSNNAVTISTPNNMQINTWYHIVGIYNGTNVLLYRNNVLQSSIGNLTGIVHTGSYLTNIGTWYSGNSHWNGTIDDVMIFNRSLSAAEISNIYNNQSANYNGYNGIPYYTDYQNLTTTGVLKVFTISTEADFVFPDYLFLVGTNNFYSPIIKSNISIDAWYEAPVSGGDTCTYGGSGNWAVTCSDYCNITTNVNGGNIGNNFTAIGVGWFKMSANISGFKNYKFGGGCNATCLSGGCIRI